jgi:hypothetical protein
MPSPQTPLPERARGFENLQLFLAPLLLLWEKGLGDEGKRFVSQSGFIQQNSITELQLGQPSKKYKASALSKVERHHIHHYVPFIRTNTLRNKHEIQSYS